MPDDSEFCQYCGNKIEQGFVISTEVVEETKQVEAPVAFPAAPIVEDEPSIDDMTPDEALNASLKMQTKNTVEAMESNSKIQPDNERDSDFGLVPEKPIFTLALMSVDGEKEYLNCLYTTNGEKIKYNRRGSMSVAGINGMIDIYETFLPSGQPYKTIYINMYGAKKSTKAPAGFVINDNTVIIKNRRKPKKIKTPKTKYCGRCGSIVDNESKVCTGCGKKFFKGIRFNKFSITVIILSLVLATSVIVNICQYSEIDYLSWREEYLEYQVSNLNDEISNLKLDNLTDGWALEFYEEYAVLVNENSKKYHKYGCDDFDESSFRIYNINAAEQQGYYACPKCH